MTRISVSSGYDVEAIQRIVSEAMDASPQTLQPLLAAGKDALAVVKPNWIMESHSSRPDTWETVITHPTVILAVMECLARRMKGQGTIALCDAPVTQANFEAIIARGGLKDSLRVLRGRWPGITIEILDLRREVWAQKEDVIVERRRNAEDPRGYVRLNLGADSQFCGKGELGRFYGADYDQSIVNKHHQGSVHEYLLSGTAMKCDLFVNVPKLKTHKKTGITCCLKNLVGVNGDKNWLPHHTEGCPADGGDEFPDDRWAHRMERAVKKAGRRLALAVPGLGTWTYRKARNLGKVVLGDSDTVIRNGNWSGNDTCWRMVLDLNRALLYGNADGSWRASGARAYLAVVDGIVGGEGDGPTSPDPVRSGVLITGADPAQVDAAACRLMGFDPALIPVVRNAFAAHRWPIAARAMDQVRVWDERAGAELALHEVEPAAPGGFRPHFGWTGLLRQP